MGSRPNKFRWPETLGRGYPIEPRHLCQRTRTSFVERDGAKRIGNSLWSGNGAAEASSVCQLMPRTPSEGSGHFALRRQLNRLLAERGADVRIAEAHSAADREMLGDYFLVGYPNRHVIVRDHVDLHEFAREIGAL
jgi:hypothetical protein